MKMNKNQIHRVGKGNYTDDDDDDDTECECKFKKKKVTKEAILAGPRRLFLYPCTAVRDNVLFFACTYV